MILYLDLEKGQAAPSGGTYVGRAQTGMSADGSPIYKYFYDPKEYETYMSRKRQGSTADKREEAADESKTSPGELKQKVNEEHEESKRNAAPGAKPASKPPSEKVEKSLYVEFTPQCFYVKE